MARVTSKLQLTLPKKIAEEYKIRPGDDLDWLPAGEAIRVIKRNGSESIAPATIETRLRLFDQATARQVKRERTFKQRARGSRKSGSAVRATDRGWTREEIYHRGLPR